MYRSTRSFSVLRPIVSVYLGNKFIPVNRLRRHYRIRKMVEANKEAGTNLNFFTIPDVDFSQKKIKAIYFDYKKNVWDQKDFPFPDIVYVRGGGDGTENLLAGFDRLGIKRINPIHAFNKGELYKNLVKDPNVRSFLPQTENVENLKQITNVIEKHGKVYVKARRGRKGTQVMRIEKQTKNGYLYSYSILGKLVHGKVTGQNELHSLMSHFFKDRDVIVQRAIDLFKVEGNHLVDFRAEVQRNKNLEIEIVGICARVGRKNAPITTHSSAYRYDSYLEKLFPHYTARQLKALKQEMNEFLIKVYEAVESRYGKFGEIGIDFAVDRKGKIWLIECNAQSAKVSIVKAYGSKADKVFLNPLEYAKTLISNDTYGLRY